MNIIEILMQISPDFLLPVPKNTEIVFASSGELYWRCAWLEWIQLAMYKFDINL